MRKGKLVYQIRIENASPMILNGLALLGTGSPEEETPKVLTGICVSPRRSLTIPADEQVVKALGSEEGDQADGARPERAVMAALANPGEHDSSGLVHCSGSASRISREPIWPNPPRSTVIVIFFLRERSAPHRRTGPRRRFRPTPGSGGRFR